MPRGKRTVRAPALDNALIRALVAELPLPAKDGFPGSARESWIAMARHAFDVVYGVADADLPTAQDVRGILRNYPETNPVTAENYRQYAASLEHLRRASLDPPMAEAIPGMVPMAGGTAGRRFYVDHDGFAMVDGQPLAFNDLPSIVTLWDERVGYDAGDVTAILWKDVGTVKMPLPPGVRLVPVTAKDAA
jgi:hypothetical protein